MAHRYELLLIATSVAIGVAASARQDAAVEITARDAKIAARLAMPQGTSGRVPVVVFVTGGDEAAIGGVRSLSHALASDGIASLRYDRPVDPALVDATPAFETVVANVAASTAASGAATGREGRR